jgi:hypothetical protein
MVPEVPRSVVRVDRLRRWRYCSFCDRAGLDGRVEYPGEPIGSRLDTSYRATPPRYEPGALKGGRH